MSSGKVVGTTSCSPPPMRLIARISLAPASTSTVTGVLSTMPPSRCSFLLIRTDGNKPGMAEEASKAGVSAPERNTAGLPALRSVATTASGTRSCSKVVDPQHAHGSEFDVYLQLGREGLNYIH